MNTRYFIFFTLLIGFLRTYSEASPTPYLHGVNIITGQAAKEVQASGQLEYYQFGQNQIGDQQIQLAADDYRIGRVKKQAPDIFFIYYPDATEIRDSANGKTIYRYSEDQSIHSIDQYQDRDHLYRSQKFYWRGGQLISRVLTDSSSQALRCDLFKYNDANQVIQETLYGNLSGLCEAPLIIQPTGFPLNNGIESYTTYYTYDTTNPECLLSTKEDNGKVTTYRYDSVSKQCSAKLIGDGNHLLSRYFYLYDSIGFLTQTIFDDGQGQILSDLTGVTNRQIKTIQCSRDAATFGQPLVTTNKYLDLESGQESLLEKIVYQYDAKGHLIHQDYFDASGSFGYSISHIYDDEGQLVSIIDSRGKMALPDEAASVEKHDDQNKKTTVVDSKGNETNFDYDPFGRLIKTISPSVLDEHDNLIRPTITHEYDIFDRITFTTDACGNTTWTTYNVRGKPISIVYPDGSKEIFTYLLDGELSEKIDRTGIKTLFLRDTLGRIIACEKYSPSGHLFENQSFMYAGNLIVKMFDGTTTTRFEYDGAGRLKGMIREANGPSKRIEWSYDDAGQQVASKEWFGPGENDFVAKIEELDAWQEKIATRFEKADGTLQKREVYDKPNPRDELYFTQELTQKNEWGQYVKVEETVSIFGIKEVRTYDPLDRVASLIKLNSLGEKIGETHYRYTANGQKAVENHIVLANGQPLRTYTIRWTYDLLNRIASVEEGVGSTQLKITSFQYNPTGRLELVVKPDGTLLNHSYDELGNLVHFRASDHSFAYEYTYDAKQRLVSVNDLIHSREQTRHYNDFDELIAENLGTGLTLHNQYDQAGRRIQLTLPDYSQVLYHYDGALLSEIERKGVDQTSLYSHHYFYDTPSGQLTSCQLPVEGGLLSYEYDRQERLVAINSPWWSQTIEPDGFDKSGHLLDTNILDPLGPLSYHYSYADDGQLIQEQGHLNKKYQYDSLYNRLSEDHQPLNHDELNRLINTHDTQFSYDLNGNLIEKKSASDTFTYEYDALNRCVKATQNDHVAIHYIYDPLHRRVEQQIFSRDRKGGWQLDKTERFLYDGDHEIGKANLKGEITELRILGHGKGAEIGSSIAIELNGRTFIPIHDLQGSVRCLIDQADQSVAEFYRYNAYGNEEVYNSDGVRLDHTSALNPWRFCSKRVDPVTGFVAFGKRHYDPSTGRWTTPDPLFFYDTPNLYAFVKNDSINRQDLYGLFSISDVWDTTAHIVGKCYDAAVEGGRYLYKRMTSKVEYPDEVISFIKLAGFGNSDNWYYNSFGEEKDCLLDTYGDKEFSDKIRITFINGMYVSHESMIANVQQLSESHGGAKIHYIYSPFRGFRGEFDKIAAVKVGYYFGYTHSDIYFLASSWRQLINEMGGVGSGGTIIHYAHSLGGTITGHARHLLTPEEQKMIRVVTLGSGSYIPNEGFHSAVNIVSVRDFWSFCGAFSDRFFNFFYSHINIEHVGHFNLTDLFYIDHAFTGETYFSVQKKYGENFLKEFCPEYH